MKKIGVLYHPKVEATRQKARDVQAFLRSRDVTVWVHSAWEPGRVGELLDGTDLVVTVGGDGTILRAVQVIAPYNIPVTAVNLGKLGFLTEFSSGEEEQGLARILDGEGWTDERAMLRAEITDGGDVKSFHALNDVVLARGAVARLIRVAVDIDGQPYTLYKADGVIVSTATGSTGYALAAGGPVMYPRSRDFLVTAVAPHLSAAYPLVVEESAEVVLRVETYQIATVSIDGHINQPLGNGGEVRLRRSPLTARFLRLQPPESFYGKLEEKLRGNKK